jgi:hypothetical protein
LRLLETADSKLLNKARDTIALARKLKRKLKFGNDTALVYCTSLAKYVGESGLPVDRRTNSCQS